MPHPVTLRCPECGTRLTWQCSGRVWRGRSGTSMEGEAGCSANCEDARDELCAECAAAPRCGYCGERREPLLSWECEPGTRGDTDLCRACADEFLWDGKCAEGTGREFILDDDTEK